MLRKKFYVLIVVMCYVTTINGQTEKKPWWKKLFKQETVNTIEKPGDDSTTPAIEESILDSAVNDNIPTLDISEHTVQLLKKDYSGNINIHNSLPLDSINGNLRVEEIEGFRIQIYFGSLNTAKGIRATYMNNRSGDEVYLELKAPNYVVVVGNYRNKIEAYQNLHRIQKKYPHALIVESTIDL